MNLIIVDTPYTCHQPLLRDILGGGSFIIFLERALSEIGLSYYHWNWYFARDGAEGVTEGATLYSNNWLIVILGYEAEVKGWQGHEGRVKVQFAWI